MDREMNRAIDEKRWRFEKTVGIGHILTTLAIAASVFAWASSMDNRVTIVETKQANNILRADRIERDVKEAMLDIKNALIRIEAKLDRKADK